MDLYYIYSVIKYAGVTDMTDALVVDRERRLDYLLPSSEQLEALAISFQNKKRGLFALPDTSAPAEHGSKDAALHRHRF
jgi:hypothetical protein